MLRIAQTAYVDVCLACYIKKPVTIEYLIERIKKELD